MNMASLVEVKPNPNIPALAPGDTVKVSTKVVEGDRERTQVFQGVIIGVRHGEVRANFTVRRVAYGVGVERTFPLYSPLVEKVEIVQHGKVRRAKLYYLRGLSAKAARIKERRLSKQDLELEQEEALKLAQKQEPELAPEQEETPKLEQEPEPELAPEQEETPKLEQEPEPELAQEQEETPKLEQEQEPD